MQIQLYCTDRDKSVSAEIANLREGIILEVVIEKKGFEQGQKIRKPDIRGYKSRIF